eukprot:4026071-Prymnesium_polylepis.1
MRGRVHRTGKRQGSDPGYNSRVLRVSVFPVSVLNFTPTAEGTRLKSKAPTRPEGCENPGAR